jgi:hypothetical protein
MGTFLENSSGIEKKEIRITLSELTLNTSIP